MMTPRSTAFAPPGSSAREVREAIYPFSKVRAFGNRLLPGVIAVLASAGVFAASMEAVWGGKALWTNLHAAMVLNQVAVLGASGPVIGEIRQKVQSLTGQNLWDMDLGKVRAGLLNNPFIKDIRISRRLPVMLTVEVDQRIPVALAAFSGFRVAVDQEGVALPPASQTTGLPVIEVSGSWQQPVFGKPLGGPAQKTALFLSRLEKSGMKLPFSLNRLEWKGEGLWVLQPAKLPYPLLLEHLEGIEPLDLFARSLPALGQAGQGAVLADLRYLPRLIFQYDKAVLPDHS